MFGSSLLRKFLLPAAASLSFFYGKKYWMMETTRANKPELIQTLYSLKHEALILVYNR